MTYLLVDVSGRAWSEALDPRATGVPAEIGLPEPTVLRRGRGHTYRYEVTPLQAVEMALHLEDLAACWLYDPDLQTRADGRAVRDAAAGIRRTVG